MEKISTLEHVIQHQERLTIQLHLMKLVLAESLRDHPNRPQIAERFAAHGRSFVKGLESKNRVQLVAEQELRALEALLYAPV